MLCNNGSSLPGAFFSLVDLGPGAAVRGMRLEINTGSQEKATCWPKGIVESADCENHFS